MATQKEHSELLWRAFWGVLFMTVFWFILGLVHRVQLKLASAVNTLLFLKAKFPNFYMLPVSSGPCLCLLWPPSIPPPLLLLPAFLSPSCLASELFPTEAGHIVTAHHEGFGAGQTWVPIPEPLFNSCVTLSKSLNR